jgi:hypothetical protein
MLHTEQGISFSYKLPHPDGLEDPLLSYSAPYNTSLANEYGLSLSRSFVIYLIYLNEITSTWYHESRTSLKPAVYTNNRRVY